MKNRWCVAVTMLLLSVIISVLLVRVAEAFTIRQSVGVHHVESEHSVRYLRSARATVAINSKSGPVNQAKRSLSGKELYVYYIYDVCERYFPDLDPVIVQAVMEVESDYQPQTYSYAGATGLMQVIPKYHSWRMYKYGLSDIWDPYTNIVVGADFLNESYTKYGSYQYALLAYNRSLTYAHHVLEVAYRIRNGG